MMAFSYSPPRLMQLIAAVPNGAYSFENLTKNHRGDLLAIQDGGGGANHFIQAEWHIPFSGMNMTNGYLRHFYDQSGNARHMTNDSGAQMQNGTAPLKVGPRYVANFNGSYKRCDNMGIPAGDTAVTGVVVLGEQLTNDGPVWSLGRAAANRALILYQYNGGANWTWDTSNGGFGRQFSKGQTSTGLHSVVARKGVGESSATWSVRQDGLECTPVSGSVGNMSFDSVTGFLAKFPDAEPFGGVNAKICTWIIWTTKLVGQDLTELEAWLARQRVA